MQNAPKSLVVFDSGDKATLMDVNGNEYIDAMAGITVAHLGTIFSLGLCYGN
jgi:4-aminobutyrate aminotransferase-like enzyme